MPVSTRHKSALRRAEGHPLSPQNEDDLPRELRANTRRTRKAPRTNRSTRSTRSTVTPDTDEDGPPKQDQVAQVLREGNAGGYVVHNTSEQQSPLLGSFPEPQDPSSASQPEEAAGTHERRSFAEGTTAAEIPPASTADEVVHTPPHSPIFPNVTTSELLSTFKTSPKSRLAQNSPRHRQPPEGQAAPAKPVSTQTDGQVAPLNLPIITRTSPITIRPQMCTASVQTDAPADRFWPMGLFDFRGELVDIPESCSITLHLSAERETRISKVSSAAIHEIKNVLHNQEFTYERNWLTSEEAAAVSAAAAAVAKAEAEEAEKQRQLSNKRRRDDETDINRNAQRRRLNSDASPTPMQTSTVNSLRLRSRLRFKARSSSQSQMVPLSPHQAFPSTDPSSPAPSTVNYRRDGSLQLIGGTRRVPPQNGLSAGNSVNQGTTTTNDSDNEGESEGILLFPNMASANRAMFGDNPGLGPDTSAQSSANTYEPSSSRTQVTPPPNDRGLDSEPTASLVETPQTGGWGLGSLFKTARRFIPGIRGQRTQLAAPQTNAPMVCTQNTLNVQDAADSQRGAVTEPRQQDQRADTAATEPTSNFAQRLRESQAASQKTFRTKENIEEIKRMKVEKDRLQAEWARLEEERKVTEQERQDVEDAHRAAYADQQPGSKRPHRISPRVIPNPKGVSYGLDPAYFDSSDEEEEPTPLRFRPRKVRRVDNKDLSGGDALHYRGSRFSDSPPNVFSVSTAKDDKGTVASQDTSPPGLRMDDPGFNHMGHFSVPLSSSSSEEESEDEAEVVSPEVRAEKQDVSTPSKKARSGRQISAEATAAKSSSKSVVPPLEKDKSSPVSDRPSTKESSGKTNAFLSQPPMTPASQQAGAEGRPGKHLDASKTLEQRRQDLRAKLAGKSGKSVLSPKDIANASLKIKSPSKGSSTSKEQRTSSKRHSSMEKSPTSGTGSSASGNTSNKEQKKSSQRRPSQEQSPVPSSDEGFSIRGAASHAAKKSPQRLLAETLPSIYSSVSHLHAYQDFQPKLDTMIKDYLESSWKNRDDGASIDAFESAFAAYRVPEQQAVQPQATPTVPKTVSSEPSEDDSEGYENNDDAPAAPKTANAESSADDLEDNEDEEPAAAGEVFAELTAVGGQSMDPAVMAFLSSQWTSNDELYAQGNFDDQYKESKDILEYPSPSITA
ncbi:MAG: hypothetical protein L6R41_003534 [Letrouitia leprolyta]|nr:MAG: hypothetical protein L6R41_003534 [Letrouitia leprolyta]